jgi:hypothetical protein
VREVVVGSRSASLLDLRSVHAVERLLHQVMDVGVLLARQVGRQAALLSPDLRSPQVERQERHGIKPAVTVHHRLRKGTGDA